MSEPGQRVTQYAIYERPRDYPEGYIVRTWYVGADGTYAAGEGLAAASIEDARALLPDGSVQVGGRDPEEPTIVEVWM